MLMYTHVYCQRFNCWYQCLGHTPCARMKVDCGVIWVVNGLFLCLTLHFTCVGGV